MQDFTHLIGKTIIYNSGSQQMVGTVQADPKFVGGVKCNGRSLSNILDECGGWTVLYGRES